MLNRVRKILIAIMLTAALAKPAVAVNDSTISYVSINDQVYYDIEIMITDKAEIFVPFKQLANLFEIQYTANRVDKVIQFKTHDGQDGIINENGVYVAEKMLQKKPVFLKQGIMDNVINEAFITAKTAEVIFGSSFETDYSTITVSANTKRTLKALNAKTSDYYDENAPRAYQDVVLPKKNRVISLNKVGVRNNFINSNMTTQWQHFKSSADNFAGTSQAIASGDLLGGKYRAEATMFHYDSEAFMFGGVSATYLNSYTTKKTGQKYWYELGRIKGRSDVDAAIGTNIFGAQIFNYDYEKTPANKLSGYVKPTSLVRVTVNDNEPVTISTYGGYYTLADVRMSGQVEKVKIEEVNEDGTIEFVKEERYSKYGDRPFEKEDRGSVYAGVWGYQNRLFREGSNIYYGNNKKATAGGYYQYGIKDNVTFESKLTADKIYEKSSPNLLYKVPTNDSLLVIGTQKNVNYLEGATTLNSIDYVSKKDPNLKLRGTAGASIAHDIREHDTHVGYMLKGTADYSNDLKKLKWKIFNPRGASVRLEAYQTSPDWYVASSDTTSKNDRIGGRARGTFAFNTTNVSGGYNKYYSNINNRYHGGVIGFDEYTINATSRIPKIATAKFSLFHKRGSNELGRNKNYHYDAGLTRSFGRWATLQAGHRQSCYDTDYKEETSLNRDYHSKYLDTYIDLDVPIPKNLGRFRLGHNFVDYNTSAYNNNYNMFRFGYVFPTWRKFTLGLGWGFRYAGQGGHDLNATVGYRSKTGQMMTVGYQYSQNGGYFIDNMFTPTTNRHSVNFVFNDAYQLFHNGFKSIGSINDDKGIFEAIAYIDTNNNGKYDKKIDIPMKDIPIITGWSTAPEYTNKAGKVTSASLPSGVYKIALDMDSLPITVAPKTNDLISRTVKIENGLTTRLELPLASTVGSVSGVLKITDDFERDLKISDFIVVIFDQDGNEINYSTVSSSGEFYISGLAPGKYKLQLDPRFINAYGLEELPDISTKEIYIPFDYYNPTDIVDQNIEYKTYAL